MGYRSCWVASSRARCFFLGKRLKDANDPGLSEEFRWERISAPRMQKVSFLPTLPSLLVAPSVPLIHRDLSWLQFNERVLAEARDQKNPLLERVKFLAISASNLDEFFVIRLASLDRQLKGSRAPGSGNAKRRWTGPAEAILESVAKFGAKQLEAVDLLSSELEQVGLFLVRQARPGTLAFDLGRAVFQKEILPHLASPEEFSVEALSGLSNLQHAAVFASGQMLRVPKGLPPVIQRGNHYFFLDDLIFTHLGRTLSLEESPVMLRISRNGDFSLDIEEVDSASIPDILQSNLRRRDRGKILRVQYLGGIPENVLKKLVSGLKLLPSQIFPAPGSLLLQGLWQLHHGVGQELIERHGLRHPPATNRVPALLRDSSQIFERIAERDFLLHHPYDSFDAFVCWISAACADPAVTMIEQTVYRMDAVSPVIEKLKQAALAGKKVRVFIELRARFDELNNLRLADELREAGVEVYFGFGKLKLHAKIALITRREADGVRHYTHLSTGNYHSGTSRQYTDLAILTADPGIGQDARHFFSAVMQGKVPWRFKHLVSAPTRLHRKLITLIQSETVAAAEGRPARIFAKVNALVDEVLIEELYRASRAGVKVDLVVRGACSLIPGVPGLSENIRVICIVDRFLEHSRIYYFENRDALFISSADWMPRNFFSRLELAFPVRNPALKQFLIDVLIPTYLADNVKARELTPQGTWKKRPARTDRGAVRSQFIFQELSASGYRGTPLEQQEIDPSISLSDLA